MFAHSRAQAKLDSKAISARSSAPQRRQRSAEENSYLDESQPTALHLLPVKDLTTVPAFLPGREPPTGHWLQPKLTIGAANDPLEQEADAAADRVMRMADPQVSHGSTPAVSRKCAACAWKEEAVLRKEAGLQGTIAEAPASVHEVLRSPGRPLDDKTRAYFEPRFGQDFSHVRVHSDARASESARSVNAYAYTVGHNLVFDAGRFAPETQSGRRLLAHELAHVVQNEREVQPLVRRKPTRKSGKAAKKPARTFGGLKVSPNSQITAAQMVELIKESPKLAQWMKDLFAVSGDSIVLTSNPQKGFPLPLDVTDADVPDWFKNTLLAINEKQWSMTTGTSIVTEKSHWTRTKLVPDAKSSEIPSPIPSKVGQDDIITGETIDNEAVGGKQMAGEGLVVIANRFQGKAGVGTSVPRDRQTIVETFFHEFGAHAGLDSQGKFGESSHGLTGNWKSVPVTEADFLAQAVWKFFDLPDELDEDPRNLADFLEEKRRFDLDKAEFERQKAIMDELRKQMQRRPR